jgi:hypothetical protein
VTSDHPEILGPRDEIAMMLSDLGTRVSDLKRLPAKSLEVEVVDPLGGENRYAYIATAQSPNRSAQSYVKYDAVLHSVTTGTYSMTMSNELPDSFMLRTDATASGQEIARAFEIHAQALVLKLFRVRFTQSDIKSELLAYKLGPIRLVRKLRHHLHLSLGIGSPGITRKDLFYRDFIEEPITVDLPWVPSFLFGDIQVRFDIILRRLPAMTLSWPAMKGPPLEPGVDSLPSAVRDHPNTEWLMLTTERGTLAGGFIPTPALDSLTPELYYSSEPPAAVIGADGQIRIGYLLTGWERLSKGPHLVDFALIHIPKSYTSTTLREQLHATPMVAIRPAHGG